MPKNNNKDTDRYYKRTRDDDYFHIYGGEYYELPDIKRLPDRFDIRGDKLIVRGKTYDTKFDKYKVYDIGGVTVNIRDTDEVLFNGGIIQSSFSVRSRSVLIHGGIDGHTLTIDDAQEVIIGKGRNHELNLNLMLFVIVAQYVEINGKLNLKITDTMEAESPLYIYGTIGGHIRKLVVDDSMPPTYMDEPFDDWEEFFALLGGIFPNLKIDEYIIRNSLKDYDTSKKNNK